MAELKLCCSNYKILNSNFKLAPAAANINTRKKFVMTKTRTEAPDPEGQVTKICGWSNSFFRARLPRSAFFWSTGFLSTSERFLRKHSCTADAMTVVSVKRQTIVLQEGRHISDLRFKMNGMQSLTWSPKILGRYHFVDCSGLPRRRPLWKRRRLQKTCSSFSIKPCLDRTFTFGHIEHPWWFQENLGTYYQKESTKLQYTIFHH